MIASAIEGRVRLRGAMLRSESEIDAATRRLTEIPGVSRVTGNPRTGSLLVEYDPSVVAQDAVVEVSGIPVGESRPMTWRTAARSRKPAQNMRIAKQGMLASIAALLFFALTDREKQHAVAGITFLAFNAYHLYTYRRRLLK